MKYFKNKNNEIFAYDEEQVKQGYGKALTPITENEKDELLAPTDEELEEQRIQNINSYTQSFIIKKYPLEKQSSANLGIYGDEYKNEMIIFISNCITLSNEAIANNTSFEDFKAMLDE